MTEATAITGDVEASTSPQVVAVRNLTIPIYPYLPIGSLFPWESAYWTEDIATIERNEARLFFISMGGGTGTRLMGPGLAFDNAPKIHQVDLELLVNRYATVLSIPKGESDAITPQDVQTAFQGAGGLQQGDAIVLATGWGDDTRWKKLGERYGLNSPYLTPEAAETLISIMEQNDSDLLLTDCAYLDRIGNRYAREEWLSVPSWQRPVWPSDQAKAYLRHYTPEMVQEDWATTLAVVNKVWAVAGLANCGQIGTQPVRVTVLPMFVQDAGEAPCTVVAEILD